jgi:uncharacterized protein (TIGR02246 family)
MVRQARKIGRFSQLKYVSHSHKIDIHSFESGFPFSILEEISVMRNLFLASFILLIGCQTRNPVNIPNAPEEIREVMQFQQNAWNQGDIETFMEGYWKSDSMQFVGSSIRQGWQATLERYKQSYPTREAMGTLQFEIWQVTKIAEDAYLLTGKYTLQRTNDQPSGAFTLIFRHKDGKWVIAYDHTC